MAQPLHVTISSGIPREHHDTLRHLIELTATLAQAPLEHTEVHVKMGSRKFCRTTGYAYYNYDSRPFSQQAHDYTYKPNVHPDACELITLKLYPGYVDRFTPGLSYPRAGPQTMHYERYKTFPHTTLYTWEEEFVYVCAHEMHHVSQYHRPRNARGRASASELECEGRAILALAMYRMVLDGPPARGVGHAARR